MSVRSRPLRPSPPTPLTWSVCHTVLSECDFSVRGDPSAETPAVRHTGSCQSATSPQPRSPCRHTRSPQAAHDPRTPARRLGSSPSASLWPAAWPGATLTRGGDLAGAVRPRGRATRPERPRQLPLRVRRAPPGRGRAEPSERAIDRAGPGRAGGGAQGEAGGPAPTTDRPTDRPEAGVPEARSPRRLPGRLAAPSRWEATQEGPVSLSPMPRAPPMS